MRAARIALAAVVFSSGCGGGSRPGSDERPNPQGSTTGALIESSAGGTTQWVRRLGGLGDESVAALATGSDGSTTLLTFIGTPGSVVDEPDYVGLVRLDRSGAVIWSTALANPQHAAIAGPSIAVSPLGNVLVAATVQCGSTGGCFFDAGGGAVLGSVLYKFEPPGTLAWQRTLDGRLAGNVAVDGHGGAVVSLVDLTSAEHLRKYRWDGATEWTVPSPVRDPGGARIAVAFDPDANVAVGRGLRIAKLDPSGNLLWAANLAADATTSGTVAEIGTTAIGTVVATVGFRGTVAWGGTVATQPATGSDLGAFVAVAESDGSPRFGKWLGAVRNVLGAAVDPAGRLAVLTTYGSCADTVWRLNLAGALLWTRAVVATTPCDGSGAAFAGSIATDPVSHDVLVGGRLWGTVDFGSGPVASRGGVDGFAVDIAP
jgi:hypothetical protein